MGRRRNRPARGSSSVISAVRAGRRAITLVTLGLAVTAPARSQNVSSADPLALPAGMLMCRSQTPSPADSADIVLQFRDGGDGPVRRSIVSAFDSSGNVLYMTLVVRDASTSPEATVEMVGVRFFPEARGTRGEITESSLLHRDTTVGRSRLLRGFQPLTNAEVARAEVLGEWLFAHRCGRSVRRD
jgi:hypothetical protein